MNLDKSPHRWKPTYNPKKILEVMYSGDELKTSTIKKRLGELDPEYKKPVKEWYRKALSVLEKTNLVSKIKREDEIADYWVITEAGKKMLDEMENKND